MLESVENCGVLRTTEMVGEGNTSNGDGNEYTAAAVLCRSEAVQNGFAAEIGTDVADWSSSRWLQTYKRRKCKKGSSETEVVKDGRCLVKSETQLADEVCEFSVLMMSTCSFCVSHFVFWFLRGHLISPLYSF